MRSWIRPIVVIGCATALSLGALELTGGSHSGSVGRVHAAAPGSRIGEYDLAELEILETVLYHVEESYVDPGRVDFESMFVSALQAVERRVPACMFRREPGGSLVFVDVGDFATVLEIPTLRTRRKLQQALVEVAAILAEHLEAEDIPPSADQPATLADVEYTLVNGLLSTLDPHSVLLTPADRKDMDVENKGEFGGLGIQIEPDAEGRLRIAVVEDGKPASLAGLSPRDVITRIDGVSTVNMATSEAVGRLRGPVGEPVLLQVMRPGMAERFLVEVVRDRIPFMAVHGELLEGGIGYVELPTFHRLVGTELADELARLHRKSGGLRGLVLDMRGNPGGFFSQAVEVADRFLWEGSIVSTVDSSHAPRDEKLARPQSEPRYPVAVLMDSNSASAAEIVAGALRNNGRAVIVGERSFGKGSVQNLHDFHDQSRLKLTVSKYLTPNEQSIQSVGIPADIELVPQIVTEDVISLYEREWVVREADLDQHLERMEARAEQPVYRVPYLHQRGPPPEDPRSDRQVEFCRELLLAASGWHRAELLVSASAVVERNSRSERARIERELQQRGVDWTAGPPVERSSLEVELSPVGGNALQAGERGQLELRVSNRGEQTLHRLVAITRSDSEQLNGREFIIGRLPPEGTRTARVELELPHGYPSEQAPVDLDFRVEGASERVARHSDLVLVQARPQPRLAWSWRVEDPEGDGDGIAEVGERLRLVFQVHNLGEGATEDAVISVRSTTGRAVDLHTGNLRPGSLRDPSGAPCEPPTNQAASTAAEDPERCAPRLLPGEQWEGYVELGLPPLGGERVRELEVSVSDHVAFDYASVARNQLYEHYTATERIRLETGAVQASEERREPPVVRLTRAPELSTSLKRVTVSGEVEDDRAIEHVMVYDGEDKIFYQGAVEGHAVRSVPFTADLEMVDGLNTITVVAIDDRGLAATRSVVSTRVDELLQAQVRPRP